eukprot:SAG31_NODE_236_length_19594_cov_7.018620_17_plen_163_part_00
MAGWAVWHARYISYIQELIDIAQSQYPGQSFVVISLQLVVVPVCCTYVFHSAAELQLHVDVRRTTRPGSDAPRPYGLQGMATSYSHPHLARTEPRTGGQATWYTLSGFIDKRTREKVHFISDNDIATAVEKLISTELVPIVYGGEADGSNIPVPNCPDSESS